MNLSDLDAFMANEGILRIARTKHGRSVYMLGDVLGTGETIAEAYENAARQRDYQRQMQGDLLEIAA